MSMYKNPFVAENIRRLKKIGVKFIEPKIEENKLTSWNWVVQNKEGLKLGQFFKVWEKKFSSGCIFEFCNGEKGQVKMTVNGRENKDFENYVMRDKDKIVINYN